MWYLAQLLINALGISVLYGLVAVSYVLIHAVTRRINLALGGIAVVASYAALNVTLWQMMVLPSLRIAALVIGVLVAIAHAAVLGLAIDRLMARPLIRATTLAALIATFGLAIVLEEVTRLTADSRERWLSPMGELAAIRIAGDQAFPIQVTPTQLAVLVCSALIGALVILTIKRHPFGRVWRAVSDDLGMAELCGVDIQRVVTVTFVLASAAAGAAGAMMAIGYGVASYHGGLVIALKTLFVAVVGGLGSVAGAFAGGLVLGLFETLWSGYAPLAYRDVASFAVLTGLLIAFPRGLLGDHERGG